MKRLKVVAVFAVMAGLLLMGPGVVGFASAAPQTKCPVMGLDINKDVYVDYQGQRIYFCCTACLDQFKADPAKYLKKMEAQGVTPEKAPGK